MPDTEPGPSRAKRVRMALRVGCANAAKVLSSAASDANVTMTQILNLLV